MQKGLFQANKSNDAAWKSVKFLCSITSQYKIFHHWETGSPSCLH